jgi:hypothetical protein
VRRKLPPEQVLHALPAVIEAVPVDVVEQPSQVERLLMYKEPEWALTERHFFAHSNIEHLPDTLYMGDLIKVAGSRQLGTLGFFALQNQHLGFATAAHVLRDALQGDNAVQKEVAATSWQNVGVLEVADIQALTKLQSYADRNEPMIEALETAKHDFFACTSHVECAKARNSVLRQDYAFVRIADGVCADRHKFGLDKEWESLLPGGEKPPPRFGISSHTYERGVTVFKCGFRTHLTVGTTDQFVMFEPENVRRIKVRPYANWEKFAEKGDSGSAVIDEEGNLVGMLVQFYGNVLGFSVVIPIHEIVTALSLSL